MHIITLDFETYFDSEFTLSKMTTEAYVRDPRFEAHGAALKWTPGSQPAWYEGEDLRQKLKSIPWDDTACLCHHTQFDGLILTHHYGVRPKLWLDTLSMGRLLLSAEIGKSLDSLAKHFKLGTKDVPYNLFKGRHWSEIDEHTKALVAQGARGDVQLTWDLFCKLAGSFPAGEYELVDATVRMFTDPVLVGDTAHLADIWREEQTRKAALLDELGLTVDEIRKNWRFAELLRERGIEPEQKAGKAAADGSERWNYSFAKTDDFMRDLLENEDDTVRLLAETKLEAHSTGTQTRTERLGYMSTRGAMCVYLNYAGTHLAGWSGGDKVNWQNFRRGGPISTAIKAPAGQALVVADASQVECRLLNCVAGQTDVVERFRRHEDLYVALASTFYGETIYKAKAGDPRQREMEEKRGTGKQGELSCGYGAGAKTIQATAKKGAYGPPVIMSDEEALRLRDTYRSTHPAVVRLWSDAGDVLKKMHAGLEFNWHMVHIKDKVMWLPDGVPLLYTSLTWDEEEQGFKLQTRRNGMTRIWGSKLVENLIQALRNVLIKQAWRECRRVGLDRVVTMEHDKLVIACAEQEAQDALTFLRQAMCTPPAWLPTIPLDSEGYVSKTLAKPEN